MEPTASKEVATSGQAPELSGEAMEVVTALATAEVPVTEPVTSGASGAVDKADGERASKWARKKEKMLCYRCGERGHFIAECVTELCDTCLKPAHDTGECPILRYQMPGITICGVYCAELIFSESPCAREVPEEAQSTTTGVVEVTKGDVSEA